MRPGKIAQIACEGRRRCPRRRVLIDTADRKRVTHMEALRVFGMNKAESADLLPSGQGAPRDKIVAHGGQLAAGAEREDEMVGPGMRHGGGHAGVQIGQAQAEQGQSLGHQRLIRRTTARRR